MQNLSVSDDFSSKKLSLPFAEFNVDTWVITLAFGIVGFVLPMFYGYLFGFPVAHVQDELSYTVAADTYANGKITNPTPAHFEHFETSHVLMEPSYISKYPPLQGMFMAVGQVVFGHQIFGVWLSCGLFAAALFWMLSVWTTREWAILGTIAMIALIGINSYWAQSYWGGMIASAGGALFFGGFRRLFEKLSTGSTVVMTLGGVILVNSRPFEGTLMMLPSLLILLIWVIRNKENTFSKKFTRIILPGLVVGGIALSAMFYQYYRVTGNPFKLPYSVHHAQYYPAPLFSFQEFNPNANKGNPRIRQIYDIYTKPPILDSILETGVPDSTVLRSVYGFIYVNSATPFFLLSPFLFLFFFISVALAVKSSKWFWLVGATIIFTFICMAFGVWWDQHHYAAPLTCCFFVFLTEGFRRFYGSGKDSQKRLILLTFFGLIIGSFIYQELFAYKQPRMKKDFSADRVLLEDSLANHKKIRIEVPKRATFFKDELEKIVEKSNERYIAIVHYADGYDFHDEIVFNKADIANAKLIWAHDLGAEKNKRLLEFYNQRKPLLIKLLGNTIEVEHIAGQ